MTIRFDEPWWLLIAPAAIPFALLALRWLRGMSAHRRASAIIARTALISLIAAILAGATMLRSSDRLAVIAVVDASGSVDRFFRPPAPLEPNRAAEPRTPGRAIASWLRSATADKRPDDLFGAVSFGARPAAVLGPQADPAFPESAFDPASAEGTDIASALRLAAAMIPPDASGRIVLISDGVETSGNALDAAKQVSRRSAGPEGASNSVPIDVAPLSYTVEREVFIEAFDTPPTAPAESVVALSVVLVSTGPASGTLSILHEGEPISLRSDGGALSRRVALHQGRNVERLSIALPPGRVHHFDAIWEPERSDEPGSPPIADTVLSNNRAEAFTISPGRGAVLVIDGVSGGDAAGPGGLLARTLGRSGVQVQTIAPEAAPKSLLPLQSFDLVVLQNVPADAVSPESQSALAAFVSELGGGLVMIGGPNSFGAGGWKASPIEPILPVLLDLPERLLIPATAVMLVIDNSGSMNRPVLGTDRSQQQIANEGAALAIQSLDKTDLIGVISFNSNYTVEWRLSPNKDPAAAAARVRSISADGGTNLPPALEAAADALRPARADVKHVIVLSDGVSQGKDRLPDIVRAMNSDGIRVSTIAVGDQADASLMSEMARDGGGQFYRVIDPSLLPRIFLRAVRVVHSPLIREQPFTPVLLPTGSPIVDGIVNFPALDGLTLTQPRPRPGVVMPLATPADEPVLAYWSVGLGRVAAFTSDAHHWALPWIADGGPTYARFWTQLFQTIARSSSDRSSTLLAQFDSDDLTIRLDAADADGRPLDLLTVPTSVYAPDGNRTAITLSQIGPGRYEARTPAPQSGTYVIAANPRAGNRALSPVIAGISHPAGIEFRRLRSNERLLTEIAQATGGRVLDLRAPESSHIFERSGIKPQISRTSLWTALAWSLLAVMLFDIATRRIAWDRFFSREFGASFRQQTEEILRDRTAQVRAAVDRLHSRGEEVEQAAAAHSAGRALDADAALDIVRRKSKERRQAADAAAVDPDVSVLNDVPAPDVSSILQAAKKRAQSRIREEDKSGGVGNSEGSPGDSSEQ